MERPIRALTCALLLCPLAAHAGHEDGSGSTLDLFYVPSATLDLRTGPESPDLSGAERTDEPGDGYGVRTLYRVGEKFAATAEYGSATFDLEGEDNDIDITDLRIGGGVVALTSGGTLGGFFVQYDKMESDQVGDFDGYSLHGRLVGNPMTRVQLYGDVGMLRMESDDDEHEGFEFTIGASLNFMHNAGIFIDFRQLRLESEDIDYTVQRRDARAGLRVTFGGGAADSGEAGQGETDAGGGQAAEPPPVSEEPAGEQPAGEPAPVEAAEPAPIEPAADTAEPAEGEAGTEESAEPE